MESRPKSPRLWCHHWPKQHLDTISFSNFFVAEEIWSTSWLCETHGITHRIFWAGRDHKDRRVQLLSTTNLQILEDPKAGMSWAAAQCLQPALHFTSPWLISAKPCHKTYAIKSKSMLAAWSPWGLTQPPLSGVPGGGSQELAVGSPHLPRAPAPLCRMSQHIPLNWQQPGCWVWCFLHV